MHALQVIQCTMIMIIGLCEQLPLKIQFVKKKESSGAVDWPRISRLATT